jgi:hypothetical protein
VRGTTAARHAREIVFAGRPILIVLHGGSSVAFSPVHYKNPAKRFSKNHEYWLKQAAKRVAAQNALQREQLAAGLAAAQQARDSQTYRDIRNPSSMSRAKSSGILTARPLNSSLIDTSYRHFDAFDRAQTQRFYNTPYDVSALRMLEGEAAGSHTSIPIQATLRPAKQLRPQTAQPARRSNAHYQATSSFGRTYEAPQPYTYREQDAYGGQSTQSFSQRPSFSPSPSASSFGSTASYGVPSQPLEVYVPARDGLVATGEVVEPHTLRAYQPRQQPSYDQTLRAERLYLGEGPQSPSQDPRQRSQKFNPQLTTGRSQTPVIPANTLLSQ